MASSVHNRVVDRIVGSPTWLQSLASPGQADSRVPTLVLSTQHASGGVHSAADANSGAANLLKNYAIQQAATGSGTLRIQVHPQNMGPIVISASNQSNGVQVQVSAANPQTLQWLTSQSTDLANAIRSAGVTLAGLQVSGGGSGFAEGQGTAGQSGQQAQQNTPQRVKSLRRTLNASVGVGEAAARSPAARFYRAHRVNVRV